MPLDDAGRTIDQPTVHLTHDRAGLMLPQTVAVAAKVATASPRVPRPFAPAVESLAWRDLVTASSQAAGLIESAARPLSPVERYLAARTPSARVRFDHDHPLGTVNMAWSSSPRTYPVPSSCPFDPDGRTSAPRRKILPPGLGVPGSADIVRARGLVPMSDGWRAEMFARQGSGTWGRADTVRALRASSRYASDAERKRGDAAPN